MFRSHQCVVLLSVLAIMILAFPQIDQAQYHIPSYPGASNRFENADKIYGVFGDINFPFGIEPESYHRVYFMEGQYSEGDYSYLTLGFYEDIAISSYYFPYYFWKKPISCGSCYGSDVLLSSFFFGQTHNYGVQYVPSSNSLEFYFDGVMQRSVTAVGMINIGDAAIAGTWTSPFIPNPRVGVTFYNLQWVKRRASNGNFVRKTWPWSILDLRVGPYACYISSANSFTCDETF